MDNTWAIIAKTGRILFDMSFIICPNIGYIHQYLKIKSQKSSAGFSKLVSFILIISFIIRIFFWIGYRFEYAILLNAIIGILMQLILLNGCISYNVDHHHEKAVSNFFAMKEFWAWPYFMDYLYFISFFTISLSLISNIIGYANQTYVFFLGAMTALIEAFLGVPQVYEIFTSKNVGTISYILVMSWFVGDLFKLTYYLISNAPMQLLGCVSLQLLVDAIVICQIMYYLKYGSYSFAGGKGKGVQYTIDNHINK